MTSGEKLKSIRLQKGISRAELSRTAKIPLLTLEGWEYGYRQLKDINKIIILAKTLDVEIKEIIGEA